MARYLLRKVLEIVFISLSLVSIVFLAVRLIPGDPATVFLGARATPDQVRILREQLGLNKPLAQQYVEFVLQMARGNLGTSYFHKKSVAQLVVERLPVTIELSVVTMLWVLLVGVPMGIIAAVRAGSLYDRIIRVFIAVGQGMPAFWLAIMCILVFAVRLRVLPSFGTGSLKHFVLPSFSLGFALLPRLVRYVRVGMLDVMSQEYITVARGKGLRETLVIQRHALRNLLIPLVTDIGLSFAWLLGGSVVVERVFAWSGMGRLVVDAVSMRDYFVVQGAVFIFSLMFLTISALIDISYTYLDPRVRLE